MNRADKNIEIWCTLGPSSLNKRVIARLTETGVNLFRINLSHTRVEEIEKTIALIMKHTDVPVCIDTEGPQVRTGLISGRGVLIRENNLVTIPKKEVLGDGACFNIRPLTVLEDLRIGDLISVDFNGVVLSVSRIKNDCLITKVINGGWVGSNKAVTIDRKIDLAILSEKDMLAMRILKKLSLKDVSLSFVHTMQDVRKVRKIVGPHVRIISKIETNDALLNLADIINASDGILIDRGDLSREEPINKIPLLQKTIIKTANEMGKPVLVATNFLESMVNTKKPLRSEVNDVMNTLLDGADGLVLAAETAIGKYPVECANMIKRMIRYYQVAQEGYSLSSLIKKDSFLLVEPNGGALVNRFNEHADHKAIMKLPVLTVDERVIMDAEQIGIGTYSPLTGFMTKEELFSVLDDYRLAGGAPWTLPITLQAPKVQRGRFRKGDDIALKFEQDNTIYAVMRVKDVFSVDLEKAALKWFGTRSADHPGVKRLFEKGDTFIGADVELIRRKESEYKEFEFTPHQVRSIFEHKEWSKVAGFHTRNAIHRAHEYLQISALEKYALDGLFIHPVIGPKKTHDFKPHIILESYRMMLDKIYPRGKVVLAAFSAYSHYAGPREAVFTALCRKNFGCSHFIIGRDHTGVKDFYTSDATLRLFDKIGSIGITPIFFKEIHYCKMCRKYVETCAHGTAGHLDISGTRARQMLQEKKHPPRWFLRPEIASMIMEKIKNGSEVFVK
ncbi:MAG: sulfate adenylyltransferase [Candidatus Omnitrophica bacterium]|nr:sulfate adenylyltransferase [Candidatus Omnitrophota bacterium]MDD5775117.1 sulfate adenylyltransferase [Candidatus Omnitrophota bacterium]